MSAKPVMNAILGLIEGYLRQEKISASEFKKVKEMMDNFETEFQKKKSRKHFSPLSDWLIHEQLFLAGTPHASGGPPYYFLDQIEDECEGGEPAERHFKHCTELFGTY